MKKESKSTIATLDGKKINVDELCDAVNSLDKKYGLRLKHPDETMFPENYRRLFVNNSDINLVALVLAVNGIPLNEFFTVINKNGKTGYKLNEKVGFKNIRFSDLSVIDWESNKKYDHNSLIFRVRFVTLVLLQILKKTGKITYREVMSQINGETNKHEYGIIVTKELMQDIILFINVILTPDVSYRNIILKIFYHTCVSKDKYSPKEIKNSILYQVLSLRDGLNVTPLTERFFTDDLGIYNITKLAYQLTTGLSDLPKPHFADLEGATINHNLILVIKELGKQIKKAFKHKNCTPMFRAYVEAHPRIYSDFNNDELLDPNITLGLTALSFTDFVCDTKYIHKFISEMLKTGK